MKLFFLTLKDIKNVINISLSLIIILSSIMIFMVGCGYTPLLNTQNINFYISEINYEGDRNVNSYIKNN